MPEQSQTTDSSTPSSTSGSIAYKRWGADVLKLKTKKLQDRVERHWLVTNNPHKHSEEKLAEAYNFFSEEFPGRSPWAVYQRMRKMKQQRVIVLSK